MKKKEAEGIGALILFGIVAYPFIWLYENIGWEGMGFIAISLIVIWVFWAFQSSKKANEEFNKLVIYTLHNRLPPNEARKINAMLLKSNLQQAQLIRNLQIFRDSVEIALSSKKRDTAESRMQLAQEKYSDIKNNQSNLVKSETMSEIISVMNDNEEKFHTNIYNNIALAHLEKADKLKTIKSKNKYLEQAKEILNEGLDNDKSCKNVLNETLSRVETATGALSENS